ncbi:hypothetical protein [Campylobacter fetus]|uniref:hypothetical protein n=3 Tax=Campylobacter fetus TaxID=196 RepID=UPI000818B4DE|nr:hypothetical protein [Campylobacter fetus]OCR84568.1 hypothetical protein CFT12S05168_09125 [Campylobacter fetus subsp. testudinum]OCS10731.1 hypothetical protein CFTD6690_08810 [Campylobacter fetus subsp. testudinum]OCS12243.1 hypothetical protein CFTD6856_08785 [Campylobacter fetus subsp. testudinum]
MQTTNYLNLSERKLFSTLNLTKSTIQKLQLEKDRLEKKINTYLQKETQIKKALISKLNEDNLKIAIEQYQNGEVEKYQSFEEYEKGMNA